MTIDMYCKYSH